MTKLVSKITLGVDVAKDQLVICNWSEDATHTVPNQRREIRAWLRSLHGPCRIAIEPTSHYHFQMVEEALKRDNEVYLINPRQLAHYREAVAVRHKSDPQDAWLLARYLAHEAESLAAFRPRDPRAQRLWGLMTRRATVVQSRQKMQMSFQHAHFSIQALMTQFKRLLERLDQQVRSLIRELGWWTDYQRCLTIPGVGPNTAAALVATYHRGSFASSDAFVAYMGLDIKIRESGRFKGKAKLTKCGEGELRRLLYCASNGARCYPLFDAYRQRQLERGRSKIAARVALARKLARIAFALMTQEQEFMYQPKKA